MSTHPSPKNIAQVLQEFLDDQGERLRPSTFANYESIVSLYRSHLETYWPSHEEEYVRITDAGGTFCGTFGAEETTVGLGMFLSYFMPRKVMCGEETMKAAGTVTRKLVQWLASKGYAERSSFVEDNARKAARDLPKARRMLRLLDAYLEANPPPDSDEDGIMDHFDVVRIEPGVLWLESLTASDETIGPIPVPPKVTDICGIGWDIGAMLVKTKRGWRLAEVWNVSP